MDEIDYHKQVYQLFLPEMIEMNDRNLFRDKETKLLHVFDLNLSDRISAAVLYGVAKRYGCDVSKIEPNSEEEYGIRRVIRGKFNATDVNDIVSMSEEELTAELERMEYSTKDLQEFRQRLSEITRTYDRQDESELEDDSDEELLEERIECAPGDLRVTKAEALFRINGKEKSIVYCRAETVKGGYEHRSFVVMGNEIESDENIEFDYSSLAHNERGYQDFIHSVAAHLSSITEQRIKPGQLIKRLEKELKEREE